MARAAIHLRDTSNCLNQGFHIQHAGVEWGDLGCEWGGMAWNQGREEGGYLKVYRVVNHTES